jgi:hypothetical protein
MKKSVVGKGKFAKYLVATGKRVKTSGGLKSGDIIRNKNGRYVSKKKSAQSKKRSNWTNAVVQARKALGLKGFCAVGGKSAAGSRLLQKVRSIYKKK